MDYELIKNDLIYLASVIIIGKMILLSCRMNSKKSKVRRIKSEPVISAVLIWLITLPFHLLKKLYRLFRPQSFYLSPDYAEGLEFSISNMDPREFEIFCAKLFKKSGYKTTLTPASNDYGRDIIIEKDGKTAYVECKRWSKNSRNMVGREICEKLMGACVSGKGVKQGIVINTGKYHFNAYEYMNRINDNGEYKLQLWSEKDLVALYQELAISNKISKPNLKLLTFK